MLVAQPATVCAPASSSTVWFGALGEARRVVDAGSRDRERLRGARVDAAVRRAAVVAQRTRDVGRRRSAFGAGCRSACRSGATAGCVENSAGLSLLTLNVRAWPASSAGPALMPVAQPATVCAPVSSNSDWLAPLVKLGRVVDRRHRDGERLRGARVDAAVGDAAVVAAPSP